MSSRPNSRERLLREEESEYGSLSDSAVRQIDRRRVIEGLGQIVIIVLAIILSLVYLSPVLLKLVESLNLP